MDRALLATATLLFAVACAAPEERAASGGRAAPGLEIEERLAGPVAEIVETIDGPGPGPRVTITTYDEAGRPRQRVIRIGEEPVERLTYEERDGTGIAIHAAGPDGQPAGETRTLYDEHGRAVERVRTDAHGLVERKVLEPPAGGRVAVSTYGAGGALAYRETIEPRPGGGWIRIRADDPKAAGLGLGDTRELFDAAGRRLRTETLTLDGELVGVIVETYRDDPRGNWIERRTFHCPPGPPPDPGECGDPTEVARREIRYR